MTGGKMELLNSCGPKYLRHFAGVSHSQYIIPGPIHLATTLSCDTITQRNIEIPNQLSFKGKKLLNSPNIKIHIPLTETSKKMQSEASVLTPPNFWAAEPLLQAGRTSSRALLHQCPFLAWENAPSELHIPGGGFRLLTEATKTAAQPLHHRRGRRVAENKEKHMQFNPSYFRSTRGFCSAIRVGSRKSHLCRALPHTWHFISLILDQQELYLLYKKLPQQTHPKEKTHGKLCVFNCFLICDVKVLPL